MAAKLPRRVQSMAKRAGKLGEAAAAVVKGEENGEDQGEGKEKLSPFAYSGAWIGGIVTLMVIVIGVRLLFAIPLGSGEPANFAPAGALSRATPVASTSYPGGSGSTSTAPSVPRSPFPVAQQDTPIILEVTCPDGTVEIATGDNVADTVCVKGVLVTDDPPQAAADAVPDVILITANGETATIGGTDVPNGLQCEEDEVIGFDGQPDTLVCVHVDSFLP